MDIRMDMGRRTLSALGWLALVVVAALGLGIATANANSSQGEEWPDISPEIHATGANNPSHITHAGDGGNRLFVVERAGRIRILQNGSFLGTLFLDISDRTVATCEQGLLSMAFPPGYSSKGYFYVNYTNLAGDTVVARFYLMSGQANQADPDSEEILLTIDQPACNHNGGQIAFSPVDGYLYIGMGDGGGGGDPQNRAQTPGTPLGKMLRIDSESDPGEEDYLVPPTNPFTETTGYLGEIWALGLRNPWRFSFDSVTGDMYIADVGQDAWEEINFQPASSVGGENWGWRLMEAFHCYNPSTNCNPGNNLDLPVWEYAHAPQGCSASVTGGHVYRGTAYPRMEGLYFYADYCTGRLWALRDSPLGWQNMLMEETTYNITTFGQDEAGNLYAANASSGIIYLLADSISGPTPTTAATQTHTRTPTRTATATTTPLTSATPTGSATATAPVVVTVTGTRTIPTRVTETHTATATSTATTPVRFTATPSATTAASPATTTATATVPSPAQLRLYLPLVQGD